MALLAAAPGTAAAASEHGPFVVIDAHLDRIPGGAIVTGRVKWDKDAAADAPNYMIEGDLRLVAVSEHGHNPTVLDTARYDEIATDPTQEVHLRVDHKDADAIERGNRVVLTASQHGEISAGTRTERTYVTVASLQKFGSDQDRIGRRDCAGEAIEAGAHLDECDLVGADLDRALVSTREDGTRMRLADLTGASLRGADLTGLNLAGGRLNGADANEAVLDNIYFSGAEATRLHAEGATVDRAQGTAGGNIFDANLTDANFHGAELNGLSLNHSDLDGADFGDATWNSVEAETASFRGADLRGLEGEAPNVYFADFEDAKLQDTPFTALLLEWAKLCHTGLPDGVPADLADRDCRSKVEERPEPPDEPFITVTGSLKRAAGSATIKGTIEWSASSIALGKSAGDIRVVAVDGSTGLPTVIATKAIKAGLEATTEFQAKVTKPELLGALGPGNRVVLTATQHEPLPERVSEQIDGAYVNVDTLQPGPGRGRVGSRDCSDLLLSAKQQPVGGYKFCDLAGAALTRASLSGATGEVDMRDVDLTGAELEGAELDEVKFDGGALAGVDATGADFDGVTMIDATAPRLTMPKTRLSGDRLRGTDLDGADFSGSVIAGGTFATSSLRKANFSKATLASVDLGFTRLTGAQLDGVNAEPAADDHSSLFLADLTDATLADSHWPDDEEGERPWQWATLCRTKMPADSAISGDRDCPRPPS
jgi:uncharacterized protein YjbI with pentapeptide repeats